MERRAIYAPVFPTDVGMLAVATGVDDDADNNENYDRGHFQERQPILYSNNKNNNQSDCLFTFHSRCSHGVVHTELAVSIDVCGVHANEENPKYDTDDPWIWNMPKVKNKLGGGEVTGDGNGVVEPVVPG